MKSACLAFSVSPEADLVGSVWQLEQRMLNLEEVKAVTCS